MIEEQWVMKSDNSSTAHLGGAGIVLYREGEAVALSFKLEFPYSNNTAEYEAYLTELTTTLKQAFEDDKWLQSSGLPGQRKFLFEGTQFGPVQDDGPENGGKIFNIWDRARLKEQESVCRRAGYVGIINSIRRN